MYAIIEIGGKQYRVEKNSTINVDKLDKKEKDEIKIDKILFFAKGDTVQIGQPYLKNVTVKAKVIGAVKGKKVRGIKFKKRKNYTRTLGHRQNYTQLKIQEVSANK